LVLAAGCWLYGLAGPLSGDNGRPERTALWPSASLPAGEGFPENAYVSVYRPSHPNGTAVVICPGGGYGALNLDIEGHETARWLDRNGIVGVVLEYRLPHGDPSIPLRDARQAIRFVRAHAAEWSVHPERVGILGFSAGGHLASMAAILEEEKAAPGPGSGMEGSCRPDFAVLVYPLISMGPFTDAGSRQNLLGLSPSAERIEAYSAHRHVTSGSPPVFLVHARDDRIVPVENSRLMLESIKARGVPATLCEFPAGGHGLGYGGSLWEEWQGGALMWMRRQGFVRGEP